MTSGFNTNAIMNGTDGKLWVNDELVGTIQTFTVKQKNTFEDIHKSNNYGKSRRLLGYELSGTMTKFSIDNKFHKIMENYKRGNMPEIKLIGLLENKNTGEMRRYAIKGVTFDEMDILGFEQKKALTEELPFEAEDYDPIDLT